MYLSLYVAFLGQILLCYPASSSLAGLHATSSRTS